LRTSRGSSVAQENVDAIRSPRGNATSEEVGIGPDRESRAKTSTALQGKARHSVEELRREHAIVGSADPASA